MNSNTKTKYEEGIIITTTHRLLYISETSNNGKIPALQLQLNKIIDLDTVSAHIVMLFFLKTLY